jgi:hypothetical protein
MAKVLLNSIYEIMKSAMEASRKAKHFYSEYISPTGPSFL